MKTTKYTVMIDGDTCELEFDAVDSNDARTQYLVAIAKRLVVQKTKDLLAEKAAPNAPEVANHGTNDVSRFNSGAGDEKAADYPGTGRSNACDGHRCVDCVWEDEMRPSFFGRTFKAKGGDN